MSDELPTLDSDGDAAPKPRNFNKQEQVKNKLTRELTASRLRARRKRNRDNGRLAREKESNPKKAVALLASIESTTADKHNVVTTEVKEVLEESFPELLEVKKVIWEPFPGPQTQFLEADEFEVLFSGGRAPGKTDALLMDALRYCGTSIFRGLLIRKAMPDLREIIKRAKDLYPLAYPGARWKEQEKLFVFPSGATMEFGYCDHEDDVGRYQGQEYCWLGIDELTQIKDEETYIKLMASVRKGGMKNYIRATTNPNGPGKGWVKRRFIDLGPENTTITRTTIVIGLDAPVITTRKWIHSTVFDNPIYVKSRPDYIAMLQNIDNEVLRKQWLEGDWDSADGMAFDEFERKTHVVKPFSIPDAWYRFRACDWGYKTKAVCLWFAIDFDGNIYIYRELVTTKVLAREFAYKLIDIERGAKEKVRYGVLDASAWSMRGENAPPPAEEMTAVGAKEGHNLTWRQSDRTAHSRITGKAQVHKYLQKDPETGKPKAFIFDTCVDLISCLSSLPIDKNDPEDVDTKADDHSYDAFRYGVMSRPTVNNNYGWMQQQAEQPVILDSKFGY